MTYNVARNFWCDMSDSNAESQGKIKWISQPQAGRRLGTLLWHQGCFIEYSLDALEPL